MDGAWSLIAGKRHAATLRNRVASPAGTLPSIIGASDLTPTQQAYALLWLSPKADELTKADRDILRDTLSLDERQRAVQRGMNNTRRTAKGIEMGCPEQE